jgi:CBS domain-containing protein
MPALQPSPALIVKSDTRLEECVRQMRDNNVGSLLVVSYTRPYPLVGIFTERDLLLKFDEIQKGGHWTKDISVVMRKPVITVGLTELELAPTLMLKHGFRHLPVVYEDEKGETHVAGVISMRDIFKGQFAKEMLELNLPKKKLRVGVLAAKDERFRALCNVFETQDRAKVDRLSLKSLEAQVKRQDFVFVDIDGFAPRDWASCLQELNRIKSRMRAFVLFSPAAHDPRNLERLTALARTDRFAPFAKPVNVLELLGQLNRWRARGG